LLQPTVAPTLDDGGRENSQETDSRGLPRQIELMLAAGGIGRIAPSQQQTGEADRQIDQKDASPAEQCNQAAADQRSSGESQTGASRPQADRCFCREHQANERKNQTAQ
jgi:hypothetical protein